MTDTPFASYFDGRPLPQHSFSNNHPLQYHHQPRQFQAQPALRLRTMEFQRQRSPLTAPMYEATYNHGLAAPSSFKECTNTSTSVVSHASFLPEQHFMLPDGAPSMAWPMGEAPWHGVRGNSTVNSLMFRPAAAAPTATAPTATAAADTFAGVMEFSDSSDATQLAGNSGPVPMKVDNSPKSLASHKVIPHVVDASQYQNVHDEDWFLSVVDYDSAPSPSSIDSHGSGPHTPMSPVDRDLVGVHFREASSQPTLASFAPKIEAPSSFPSYASWSGSFPSDGSQLPTTAATSFGDLSYPRQLHQPHGFPLSLSVIPPSIFIDGSTMSHAHGLPMYEAPSSQAPSGLVAPQQVFQPFNGNFPENDQQRWENTPETSSSDDESASDVSDQAVEEARLRRDRDKYLLRMRERGMSYKEIKRRGKFREAESTLRGRIRVLTKDKSERVRRPDWTADDLALLERAVSHFVGSDGSAKGRDVHSRVPWKKISEWMRSRGSSYTFAPATCAKKYRDMHTS